MKNYITHLIQWRLMFRNFFSPQYEAHTDSKFEQSIYRKIESEKTEVLAIAPSYKGKEFGKKEAEQIYQLIESKFDAIKAQISLAYQSKFREGIIRQETGYNKALEGDTQKNREQLLKNREIAEFEKNKIKLSYDFSKLWLIYFALLFLYIGEAVLFYFGLVKVMRDAPLYAALGSIAFSIAVFYTNGFVVKWLAQAQGGLLRLRLLIVTIAYLALFYSLAVLRAKMTGSTHPYISIETLFFTLTSTVLTIGSMVVTAFKLPSEYDRVQKQEYDKQNKRLKSIDQEIKLADAQLQLKPFHANQEMIKHISMMSFEKHLIDVVDKAKIATYNEFLVHVRIYSNFSE